MEDVLRRVSLVPLAFPCFVLCFGRGGNRRVFRLPGAGGGSFPLCGGTFARSYSVSKQGLRAVLVFWQASPCSQPEKCLCSIFSP